MKATTTTTTTVNDTVEKNKVIELNYIKEHSTLFNVEKIKEKYSEVEKLNGANLKICLELGKMLLEAKEKFYLAEAKQWRKTISLKMSIEHFYLQFYSISESYANRLIKGVEHIKTYGDQKLTDYLTFGYIEQGRSINIDNFNAYCTPKKETTKKIEAVEAVEVEAVEVEAVEVEAAEAVEAVDFGGVKLSLSKATKKDIEEAIEYLMNKIS
jgi:hypothetical protein